MQAEAPAENKRLLYVGLTRARDMNVAASFVRKAGPGRAWVQEIPGAADLLFGDSGTFPLPGGQTLSRLSKTWTKADCAIEPPARVPETLYWFTPRPRVKGAPLWHRPSSASGGTFQVAETDNVGVRLSLAGKPDMASLGTALHLCIARSVTLGGVAALEVERILKRWAVADAVDKNAVSAQIAALQAWLANRWSGCPVQVEVPVEADGPNGTRIQGRIDLLVDTPDGWILIDHKSNPGGSERDADLAAEHGPQLESYGHALVSATGKSVSQQWLYLPVAARAVRLTSTTAN